MDQLRADMLINGEIILGKAHCLACMKYIILKEIKMKKLKKSVTAFLAMSLLLTAVLSGCAGKENEETKNVQDGGSQNRGKISVSVYDRGNVPAAEGTIENNRWTKWINENGPVDVEFVAIPRNDSAQKINVLFASESAPDLIFEYSPATKTPLYNQKQLMPIDDMIQKYSTVYKNYLEQYPALKKAAAMSDGKMYQFGKLNSAGPLRAIIIRADWLQKLNLDVPKTAEDYYKVARAFAEKDPDGNGKNDTYGMALSGDANLTVDQMFQSSSSWLVENNELVYGWDQIKAKLEFKKRLFDEGIIDKDYMNDNKGAKASQDFVSGKVGIYPALISNWRDFTVKQYATLKKNVPEAKLMAIPYAETTFGRFNPTFNNPVQMTAVVNARCKNPEAVMKYVDFISSKDTGLALNYGIEGVHYRMESGKPEIIDAEKHKNEVSYNVDFRMLLGINAMADYASDTDDFNLNDPIEKEGYEMYKNALKIYLDTSVPYAELTHSEHMPQLPNDLSTINANINMTDFFDKAVVSGSSYTVDKAMNDAKAAWEKGGGKQIEDWMKNWYMADKDKAFLAKDIYDIIDSEKKLSKLK